MIGILPIDRYLFTIKENLKINPISLVVLNALNILVVKNHHHKVLGGKKYLE